MRHDLNCNCMHEVAAIVRFKPFSITSFPFITLQFVRKLYFSFPLNSDK